MSDDSQHFAVRSRDVALDTALRIVRGARRRLSVLSPNLDPTLYAQPAMVEAFKAFAIAGRGGQALFLVQNPGLLARDQHALIPLVQRLSSALQVRVVEEAVDLDYPSAYLAGDGGDALFHPVAGRSEGEATLGDPARARQLQMHFDTLWERARPCVELRALGL
ncbi:hypothetical protein [Coralloluteibacterium stylophorae]|uniref:DUF7931 domain-containing protein n=1 Tax=Coralloluteibacterium stylophorae TaxID=1776034 RepID=A0A8J7VUN5_9GAMM|nr:hypothetical protein [Coralloluteibacterium stylophorae]MBS7456303.1 hypothetical protein [Coralloluteibacterium stylophorae]